MFSSLIGSVSGSPDRVRALRRFAITITIVTLLGHLYIGFETSYACTVVSVLSACTVQLVLEWIRAKSLGTAPMYSGGRLVDFLLPAYIVGMTCAMFLFTNGDYWPLIFATTVAIGSKFLFRIKAGDRSLHFLNPSNFALVVVLVAFPSVTMVMPSSFSSGFGDIGDILFPSILFTLGCLVNGIFTKRLVLIFAWFGAFVLQGLLRYFFFDAQLIAILAVATGPIAIIFSFYMISDPGTTPNAPIPQLLFGTSIGLIYGLLTTLHIVYGIFIALMLTCCLRGLVLYLQDRRNLADQPVPQLAA